MTDWSEHVHRFAKKHKMTYKQANVSKKCKEAYKKRKTSPMRRLNPPYAADPLSFMERFVNDFNNYLVNSSDDYGNRKFPAYSNLHVEVTPGYHESVPSQVSIGEQCGQQYYTIVLYENGEAIGYQLISIGEFYMRIMNSNLEEAFESIRAIYIDFQSIIRDEQGRGFSRVFLLFDFILASEYNKLGSNYYIMCTNVAQNSLGAMLNQYLNYGFSRLTDDQDGQIKCTADPSVSDYYEDDFNTYYKYSPDTIPQIMSALENVMEFQPPTVPYEVRRLMGRTYDPRSNPRGNRFAR